VNVISPLADSCICTVNCTVLPYSTAFSHVITALPGSALNFTAEPLAAMMFRSLQYAAIFGEPATSCTVVPVQQRAPPGAGVPPFDR